MNKHTKQTRRDFLNNCLLIAVGGIALQSISAEAQIVPIQSFAPRCDGQTDPVVTIENNHGHALQLTIEDLNSVRQITLNIKGSSGHNHTIILDCATLQTLKEKSVVTIATSQDANHSHEVKIQLI